MSYDSQDDTRLWMSGVPVRFVKWNDRGLVYASMGGDHDLSSLTKGMVKRLLRDGLLVVEGFRPDWVHSNNGYDD